MNINFIPTVLIIFLSLGISVYSQDLKKTTRQQNVVFVLFDSKDLFQKKYNCEENNKPMLRCYYDFILSVKNEDLLENGIINLVYNEYADFDEMERNNPVPVLKVNKRFLKNNKDEIITLDYLNKIGHKKSFELFKNAKHIFLIDNTETVDGQITIKKVFLFNLGETNDIEEPIIIEIIKE